MILVDNRVGSKELLGMFPPGRARLARLEFADFAFTGNGPCGLPWLVGVERKTIDDLVNCIASGRLSGSQLEGLVNGYNTVHLVVEGMFKADVDGRLVKWARGKWNSLQGNRVFMLWDVLLFLHTLENVVGVKVWRTMNRAETVDWVVGLHQWWTVKEWEEHHGHEQPHTGNSVEIARHSFERRVAAQLKGVGWERAKEIAGMGVSVGQMVGMEEKEWEGVKGIGKVLAKSIVKELWGIK